MAVITLPERRNPLDDAIMQILAQSDARRMERERLAQQQAQFDKTYGLDEQQTAAQVAALNAASGASAAQAGKTNYEVASDRAGLATAPIIKNYEAILNNAGPERAAEYIAGAAARISDPEAQNRLRGYLETRPRLPMDDTNASLATYARDASGRVAGGGQNAMDVNLATKLLTGEQLSGAAFGNQDTREFGTDALRKAVAIADDRAPGATAQLQASTQLQSGREQNASAERIAAARMAASAAEGAPPLPPELQNASGKAVLDSLDPATAAIVKGVAEYRIDPTKAASSRNPKNADSERLKLIRLAIQYNPSYDMTQFPAMAAARKDFSSGKAAGNIRSLNTALKHLDEFDKAYKALGNWQLPILNRVGNAVNRQLGDESITNFNSAATAVADELATLFKGTAGTDSAIAHWRDSLDPNMSEEQFKGQVHMLLDLVGGRIAALEDQYKATTGQPMDFEILSPTSQKILDKFGFKHASVQPHGGRMTKTQKNTRTGETRTVYSDDGGVTWHP